jgi:MFS transporter, DHA1 family, multidrug resistance protein
MLPLLGALSAFGPLSMDMYLPSTPTIAANLHASQTLVQLTLSGCLAGLAVGQLVAGPLSDGLGRKKPLLAGVAAFAVLSVACAVAPDIGALIAFRFLQGMAGATGVVLSLAIVRDLYAGSELARVLGSLMLVFGLAPVLAPVIGGQVLRFTSWRGVFGVLAAIGLVLLAASSFLPETLPPERRSRSRLRRLVADSRTLTRDHQYAGNAVAVALGNAALITYISAMPFIVEDAYHKSPQLFSLFFTINAIGLTSMSQLGARLVRRLPVTRVVRISLLAMAIGGGGFLAAALTGHPPLVALLSPLAGLGGQGAATVAGIMIGTLCLGGLIGQLLITKVHLP